MRVLPVRLSHESPCIGGSDAHARCQYGPRILAEPPAQGVGRILYVGLPLAFVLSAAAVIVFLRNATVRRPAAHSAPAAALPSDDAYARRLDDELRDMD